jgi:hypothetical protein
MSTKKYAKNLMDFVKEEDKRQKLTVLISADNKNKIRKKGINASKLIDAFLTDFFMEVEKQEQADQQREQQPTSSPTAHSSQPI